MNLLANGLLLDVYNTEHHRYEFSNIFTLRRNYSERYF